MLCTFNYSLRIGAPLGLGWKVLNCPPPLFPPQRGPKTSAPGLTSLPSPPLLLWSITTPLVWKSEEDFIWKSIAYQHWKGSWLVFILHICLPFFVRMQNWRHSQVYVSSERLWVHKNCTKYRQRSPLQHSKWWDTVNLHLKSKFRKYGHFICQEETV